MNAIVKKNKQEIVTETAFDGYSGEGYGHQDSTDFLIPRAAVLGDLSPQLKKNKAEYIEGAEVGDIVDVAMQEILAKQGEAFDFLPVTRVKEVILWKPRNSGGGIIERQPLNETMDSFTSKLGIQVNDKFEYKDKDGNEWIETHQYYGLNLGADCRWMFIPMKKSNLKIAKKWFTKAIAIKMPNGAQAPLFYKTYKIGSFLDSGAGNEWFNWTVGDGPLLQDYSPDWNVIFESATKLLEAVSSGEAVGDVREPEETDDAM